ncbi:MAG: serine hydrolase domain-containing protein [Bacteroidales bacterium]
MKIILALSILALTNGSCSKDYTDILYQEPDDLGDGLMIGTLPEVQMDTQLILNASGNIRDGKFGEIHSMLIYRNDRLVYEEYFPGHLYQWNGPNYYGDLVQYDESMLHGIMSCTKSFTSACIDMAIQQGYIESVDQSIFDYLPDYQEFNTGLKSRITIEHLLTMTSGLEWNEWNAPHGTSANDIDRLYFECGDDPLRCVLERPMVDDPGESFTYSGGGMVALGEILKNATGSNILEFARENLFDPLGIDTVFWSTYPGGQFDTGGGMLLRPRDMMKFGVTYLNEGLWNGERLISADWVKKSSKIYRNNSRINIPIEDSGRNGYGYTWWISEVGKDHDLMYRANGWGGQVIMVIPPKEMVVVFTSGNWAGKSSLFEILEKFILPAVQ